MEIKEIVDFHINNGLQILQVEFRILEDEDDVIRTDKILFSEIDSFGFGKLTNMSNENEIDDEDFDIFDFENEYNEYDVIEFLNEYYLIFPERLPETKFY